MLTHSRSLEEALSYRFISSHDGINDLSILTDITNCLFIINPFLVVGVSVEPRINRSRYTPLIATIKQQLAAQISTLAERNAQELAVAQIKLNTEEAQGNWFQSSWRPATGWVCVCGFAVNFLISPLAAGFGVVIPQADTGTMLPVLMGMLGLSGMRSFEKTKKIEGK